MTFAALPKALPIFRPVDLLRLHGAKIIGQSGGEALKSRDRLLLRLNTAI